MKEILAIMGTIAIGVAIRFIYDFLVKPAFKKEGPPPAEKAPLDKNSLKSLKKEAKAAKKAAKK